MSVNPLVDFCNEFSATPSKLGSGNFNRARNLTFSVQAPLESYFCLGDGLSHRIYALLVQAEYGKQAEPMITYDKETRVMLNNNNCFTSAPGIIFRNQKQKVFERLSNKEIRDATLIFAREYDLNVCRQRPRLWTINFTFVGDTLHVNTVFGHCALYPMFSYDILAVKVIAETMHRLLKTTNLIEHYFIHSIINRNVKEPVQPKNTFSRLHKKSDLYELLDLENQFRVRKLIKPIPNIALQPESVQLFEDLSKFWEERNVRKSTNVK